MRLRTYSGNNSLEHCLGIGLELVRWQDLVLPWGADALDDLERRIRRTRGTWLSIDSMRVYTT